MRRDEEVAIAFVLFGAVLLAAGWIVFGIFTHVDHKERAALASRERVHEALDAPGGLPTNPIEVASAAAIEPRAEAEACRICGGRLHVEAHDALQMGNTSLRHVRLRCGGCGHDNQLFFRLREPPS